MTPVGQQRHRAVPVKVHQHRAIGVPLAHRPVVHAKGGRRCGVGHWRLPDQTQQGVPADGQPYVVAQARTGRAAERQAHGSEPVGQPRRLARPGRGDAGQAFGEDATLTLGVVAEELPNAELDGNGMLAPGQVSQDAPISTMGPPGSPVAERASRRAGAGGQGRGDRRRDRLNAPGFEPDHSRIRQQAGDQVHSPHVATAT